MKTLLLLVATSVICAASTITFTGVIDQAVPPSPFLPGDVFIAKFSYDPDTGLVNRGTITVEDQRSRYWLDGTRIAIDSDPCHGSVFFQVVESPYVEITMQAATPDCAIPDLDDFNLNNFIYLFNSLGHMTRIPRIRP